MPPRPVSGGFHREPAGFPFPDSGGKAAPDGNVNPVSNSHCAQGRDTPEDEGYFDRDFPIEIDDDYLSAGMRQGRQATLLHAHGRSGNLAKDVAGEQSEEVDTSDWEVVSNSGGDMIAMFAKHVGPVRNPIASRIFNSMRLVVSKFELLGIWFGWCESCR